MPVDRDLSKCAECACFAIRRAARAITQHYDRMLRPSGLRATQFTLLTMLAISGPSPLSRVADRLGMERTTLTRNLRPLVARGLVTVGGDADRRVRSIAITGAGRRALVDALPLWRRAQHAVTKQLNAKVFASLDGVTERLAARRSTNKSLAKERTQ